MTARYWLLAILAGVVLIVLLKAGRNTPDAQDINAVLPADDAPIDASLHTGPERPNPATRARSSKAPAKGEAVTNLLARLLAGEAMPKPSAAELQGFVDSNNRSVESLLGAYRATGDDSFLKEALLKGPKDPKAAFYGYYFQSKVRGDEPANADRRQWLDAMKESDPENALPYLLSARDYFKKGDAEKAMEELKGAYLKPGFKDFSLSYIQETEDAYRSLGYPEAEAKAIAACELPLPHLAEIKLLQKSVIDQAVSFREAGDPSSAQAALELAASVFRRLEPGKNPFIIHDLVGMSMERQLLGALEESAPYGATGQTVRERMAQLQGERDALKEIGRQSGDIMARMNEQDVASYFDRLKLLGERNALQWALNKYGSR